MVAHAKVPFKSYSQAGQDRFVHELIGDSGTYLEIGANAPIAINNTYALECAGWSGLSVDNSGESMLAFEKHRKNFFYLTDAAAPQNWQAALAQAGLPPEQIDYLSLDVDEATLQCLSELPLHNIRFSVLTVESDEYRFPGRRDAIIDILRFHGYDVLAGDVCDQGLSFEVWAVNPRRVDMKLAARFRRDKPTEWREFFV
jgi:hypothetical protein